MGAKARGHGGATRGSAAKLVTTRTLELLREAINLSPDVFFVKDWDHRLLLVNQTLAHAMGLSVEEMEGHLDTEFWPKQACDGDPTTGKRGYHQEDRDALKGRKTFSEERVRMSEPVERVFHTNRVPLRDEHGIVYAVLGHARDVTAQFLLDKRTKELEMAATALAAEADAKQLVEEELRLANSELEQRVQERTRALSRQIEQYEQAQAEKRLLEEQLRQSQKLESIGRLAGGIAHDFNNVLTMIVCGVDLALQKLPKDEATRPDKSNTVLEDLRMIQTAAGRAAGLTSQLLTFARKQTAQHQTIDLARAVQDQLKLLTATVSSGIRIVLEKSDQPAWIVVGQGQAEQVLTNLIVNACDAMDHTGEILVTIKVGQSVLGLAAEVVRLTIEDEGTGMSDELRQSVFEPFFTTKRQGEGTGLGLSVVYGIVKQANGDLRVDSTVGKGTRFTLEIPHASKPKSACPTDVAKVPDWTGLRVLLVDDEVPVLTVVARMLEGKGMMISQARDADTAMALLSSSLSFDVILTDVAMPGISGPDFVSQAQAKLTAPLPPVVFMSGNPTTSAIHATADNGIRFVAKPFTLATLLRALATAIDTDSAEQNKSRPGTN